MSILNKSKPLFILSLAAIAAAGCIELELPYFPEYGEDCPNLQYYLDSRGQTYFKRPVSCEAHNCTDDEIIIKTMNDDKCPKYTYCFYKNEYTPFCAEQCPKGQHIFVSEGRKSCVDDTDPLRCGENNINCLQANEGWAVAKCEITDNKPRCVLESCLEGWRKDLTLPNTCVNAQTCCGAFCSNCAAENKLCYSQTQDFESDTHAACTEDCSSSTGSDPDSNNETDSNDLIACNGACVDRTGNSYCGSLSSCIPNPCSLPQKCLPTDSFVTDEFLSIQRKEYKCLCESKDSSDVSAYCPEQKNCQSLLDIKNCGRCGNDCSMQNDAWEESECRKLHENTELKCFEDSCDLSDEIICSPTKCKPGYSLTVSEDINICKEDSISDCGPNRLNCADELKNAVETACESGECIAKTCTDDYIVGNKICIPRNCSEGAGLCDDLKYMKCIDNHWKDIEVCSTDILNASAVCSEEGCSFVCNDAVLTYCKPSNACVDTDTDINHCGECGSECSPSSVSNSTEVKCASGHCIAVSCDQGYYLDTDKCTKQICNPNTWTCEGTSHKQCNEIGSGHNTPVACPAPENGQASCKDGMCEKSCNASLVLCADACVDTKTNMSHCGSCGNVCSTAKAANSTNVACTGGACKATACASGYYLNNGTCTKQVCTPGAWTCEGTSRKQCNTSGSGYNTPVACPAPENGKAVCNAGDCSFTCNSGYYINGSACTKQVCSPGAWTCEGTSRKQCNTSGSGYNTPVACPTVTNGTPACTGGTCGKSCNSGYSLCAESCVAVSTNMSHCGSCGNVCSTAKAANSTNVACTGGACKATACASGYYLNNGACTKQVCTPGAWTCEGTSRKQCNTSGSGYNTPVACPTVTNGTPACTGGTCGKSCNSGYSLCAESCVAVSTNMSHCGSCGNVCSTAKAANSTNVACTGGACKATACASGYYLNNGACTKQVCTPGAWTCEGTSRKQCNTSGSGYNTPVACPTVTNGTPACTGGTCGKSCNSGYSLCAESCVAVSTNMSHCGSCGNVCSTAKVANSTNVACTGGACKATACASGYYLNNGACTKQVCSPGSWTCEGTSRKQCNTNGSGYNTPVACPAPKNGTAACSSGICTIGCPSSTPTYCPSTNTCVDTKTNRANCGECDSICYEPTGGTSSCENGVCKQSCTEEKPTFCGECVNTDTNMNDCGSCGNVCSTAKVANSTNVTCTGGACKATACASGYYLNNGACTKQVCTPGSWICTGTSRKQCNANGSGYNTPVACPAPKNGTAACSGGICTIGCPSSTPTYCPSTNTCVDTKTNRANCGECDSICYEPTGGTSSCENGVCKQSCTEEKPTFCGECVNTDTNMNDCGSCGNVCSTAKVANSTNVTCTGGACKAVSCMDGYQLIGGNCRSRPLIPGCTSSNDCPDGQLCCLVSGVNQCMPPVTPGDPAMYPCMPRI